MSNFRRRLKKLEGRWLDDLGLVRYSDEWFEYWDEKLNQMADGGHPDLRGVTLQDIDYILQNNKDEETPHLPEN